MKTSSFVGPLLLVTLLLSFGCGSKGGGNDTVPPSNVVGVAGGTVASADQRVSVTIPAGALSSDTTITIEPAAGTFNGHVGTAYTFGPSGLTFTSPVTVSVSYAPEEIPASLGEANLGLGLLVNGEWHPIDDSTTDTAQRQVRATTNHFSVFGVIGRAMYISDTGPNHRIVRVRDFKGHGWKTYDGLDDPLEHPLGMVATDAKKRLLITDWGNSRIVRINNMEGDGRVEFGVDGSGANQFHRPAGIAVDSKGRIYIADRGNRRIVRIDDIEGSNWVAYGVLGSDTGQFQLPSGIVVDHKERIYVTDWGNHRIVRIDNMNGDGWTSVGTKGPDDLQFQNPAGITVDAQGRIYVSDWGNHRVVRMDDMSGGNWDSVGSLGTGDLNFNHPAGIAVDPKRRIHVVDRENDRLVRMDDMNGAGWITFGTTGPGEGQFQRPVGIALAVEANK